MRPTPIRRANTNSPRLFCPLYSGLGDTLYLRPFVRALIQTGRWTEVSVETAWPQMFEDTPGIRLIRHHEAYRCQVKNMKAQPEAVWSPPPKQPYMEWKPTGFWQGDDSVIDTLVKQTPVDPQSIVYDYPDYGPSPVDGNYAVIRPVTIRGEWANPSRNPEPQYVAQAASMLKDAGYKIVSVADIDPPREKLVGHAPVADVTAHKGEYDVRQLLSLVRHAAVVVGPVGWIVPACLYAHTPLIVIGGGCGHYNAPEKVADRRLDTSRFQAILPNSYCRCRSMNHACVKKISDFAGQFQAALEALTMQVAA